MGLCLYICTLGKVLQDLCLWERLLTPVCLTLCSTSFCFFICLPLELLLVVGPLTWWCASPLGAALLCSSRAGSVIDLSCFCKFELMSYMCLWTFWILPDWANKQIFTACISYPYLWYIFWLCISWPFLLKVTFLRNFDWYCLKEKIQNQLNCCQK